jgi:hypothetical protein
MVSRTDFTPHGLSWSPPVAAVPVRQKGSMRRLGACRAPDLGEMRFERSTVECHGRTKDCEVHVAPAGRTKEFRIRRARRGGLTRMARRLTPRQDE